MRRVAELTGWAVIGFSVTLYVAAKLGLLPSD